MPFPKDATKPSIMTEPELNALGQGMKPIPLKRGAKLPDNVATLAAESAAGDLVLPFEVDEIPAHRGADGNFRKEATLQIRRGWVMRLMSRGYSPMEVADILHVSYPTVLKDFRALLDEWKTLRAEGTDEIVANILSATMESFRQAEEGWESSRDAEVEEVEEEGERDGKPFSVKRTRTKAKRDGNPAFLTAKLKALEQAGKLVGAFNTDDKKASEDIKVTVVYEEKPLNHNEDSDDEE